ncbi:glycosyltransferase [Halobacillus yeomjeoni]|uniref:glycosyltransferase n=1 Tax=Halobacillus yeomjeoni TaxID=311194 RepID=UPI001CD62046|nr:glycosyltransferase family 2 protein [Halobacillus yeomjeoni]MCA0982836.1 glycosyltransferase [Halobacillus yeomjeoni]
MFWLLLLLAIFWTVILVDFLIGLKKIPSIDNVEAVEMDEFVSVIIPAKDEQESIRQTIMSLLNQRKVNLEVIAVNDRSEDQTGAIMKDLAEVYPNVKMMNIEHLPSGWLGKNHALSRGVSAAAGTHLLFTDADIKFESQALAKALTYMKEKELDHLTAAPDLRGNSFLLRGLISFFLFGFNYLKRPWTANLKNNKGGMGVGAFQLLTQDCYQSIGGHEAIKMRPDDDLALGMRIKRKGYRQNLVTALNSLSVEWYPNTKAALRGFEKNAFAGLNYSIPLALTALAGVFVSHLFPFLFLFSPVGAVQIISGLNVVLLFYLYALSTKRLTTYPLRLVFALPIFALLFVYMLARALVLTWIRGGIEWRGSRYTLKELKQHFRNNEED